jgi:nitrate/nitrite-specific signal transduction histidine kinase
MSTTDKMSENLKKYCARLKEIRSDWTRSDEAKRQDLQAAYEEARSTQAHLAEEYCPGVRERLGRSRKAAFAAPKIAGSDKASELMAYRDDLDRVSRITDTRTLSEMLARAETVGDAPLARAVLYWDYELQSEALLGSYLEKYPEEQQTWETFMEAAEEHNTLETLGTSALTGVAEPESPQELARQVALTPRGVPSGEEA